MPVTIPESEKEMIVRESGCGPIRAIIMALLSWLGPIRATIMVFAKESGCGPIRAFIMTLLSWLWSNSSNYHGISKRKLLWSNSSNYHGISKRK
jgi:hypothetical protein